MTDQKPDPSSDDNRTSSDAERKKVTEDAEQHRKDSTSVPEEKVISDPANDWPAAD